MMENKSTTEEVYSPLALLDQDKSKNFREAEGEQSVPHDPAHEIQNSVDETTYNRRKSSSQDASTPRTPISGSNRERTESHFSRATKTTTFGVLSSVVPASLVVSLMPWLEEETPLLPHQEAAILLEYARDGQDLNGSKLNLRSRLCYRLRHKYHIIFRAAAWGLVLIHIFERPVWTFRQEHAQDWNNSHYFPSWELMYLSGTTANALVFVCNIFNWVGVMLELGYKQGTSNAYLPWTFMAILLVKTIINIVSMVVIGQGQVPTFGVSPIEGFMCILVEVQHDNNVGFLLRSIPKFMVLMVGMAVFVLIYTALGMLIFDPQQGEGENVFPDFGVGLWNMAMVLNGANWPGPMVPAMVSDRIFVMYFFVFLCVVVWGLLNIVLGFNYLFFQSEQQAISDMQEKTRVDNKAAAFRILDVEGNGFLTYGQVDELLKEMYEFYEELTTPPTAAERYELILALDIQSNLMIDENDFQFIEKKCFQGALKIMRSKKRKFMRYISANMLREQSAQLLKKQADRLKIVTVSVGLKLRESQHGSSGVEGDHKQKSSTRNGYSTLVDDNDKVQIYECPSKNTSEEESSTRMSEGDIKRLKASKSQQSLSQLSTLSTFGTDAAFYSNREGEGAADVGHCSGVAMTDEEAALEEEQHKQRQGLIEKAASYASKYVDPKVLAWYKSIGDSHMVAMSKERGRVFSKYISHFAMQVDSIYFDIFSDTLIVLIGIPLLLHKNHNGLTIAYNVLTLSEMFLKLWVKGYYRYTTSNRSSVDGKIAVSLLILRIVEAASKGRTHWRVVTNTLVLLRTLLYPRNLIVTNGFKAFRNRQRLAFEYAFGSVDHFSFLLLVLVVMMYVFAGVGQQIFGGAIRRGSERISSSDYADLAFWPLNFNDMPSGMITMFTLLSVNDMNVTTSGFTAALSQWVEVFFMLWYCLGVLFFLNVLTAVFLNQFIGYLEQLAKEKKAEAERAAVERRLSSVDDGSTLMPYYSSYGYDVPLNDVADRRSSHSGVHSYSNADVGDEGSYGSYKQPVDSTIPIPPPVSTHSSPVYSYTSQSNVPSWINENTNTVPSETDGGIAVREEEFTPPDYYSPDENQTEESNKTQTPRRTSLAAVLSGVSISKTGALLSEATAKTGALLTDATTTVTSTVTNKTTELVHNSKTGFSVFMQMIVIDDSQDIDKAAADAAAATATASGAGPEQAITDSSEVLNPLSSVAVAHRGSSFGVRTSQSTSPMAGTISQRTARGFSFSSPTGRPSVTVRRSNDFIALRETMPTDADLDEENDGFNIEGMFEEQEPVIPITAQHGYKSSIFASDEERAKLNDWVKSQYKRKPKANRGRLNSSVSSGGRSRANTGAWDSSWHRSGHPQDFRPRTGTISGQSDDAGSVAAPVSPGIRKRTISSDKGETYNALLSAAANSPMVTSAEGTSATGGGGVGGGEVEMTQMIASEYQSISQPEETLESREQVDFSNQTWQEWCYDADKVTIYEEAAVLIQGALDGEDPELFTSRRGLWCFQQRSKLAFWFKSAAILYSLLKFFQRPAWTYSEPEWDNSEYFPVSGMPQWSPEVTGALKIPLLLVIMFGIALETGQQEASFLGMFQRKNSWIGIIRHMLQMYAIVQFCLVIYSLSGGPDELVAYTSTGSMLYVLWFIRRSMRKLNTVLQVVPRLCMVLALYFVIIFLFAGFGPYLYNISSVGADDDVSHEYFSDFRTATWSIFVAITSSSYPCQVMPAYRQYREFSLFFFLFITIGALFMVNLIVAIVFVEFQKASQLTADYQRAIRQVLLTRAFDVLDWDETDMIDTSQLNLLLAELGAHYKSFTKRLKHPQARHVLFTTLDKNGNGWICPEDFLYFLDASRSKLSAMPTPTFVEVWCPWIIPTPYFQMLRQMVLYPYTNLIFDCTIAVFTVTNLIVNSGNLYAVTPSSVGLGDTQMAIMLIEMFVKITVKGYAAYRRSFRNQLDSTITIGAFISVLGATAYSGVSGFTLMRRVLLIFRLFWLPRNMRYVFESKGIKRFARLCWRIVGKTLTLGVVFLCILYMFATFGTMAFGGLINRNPASPRYDALMSSRYAADGYFPLNFNDFTSSLITVFTCLHVSDFDVIAEGIAATSSDRARLFFAIWYVVGVLLMLNILKSFFLDEFLSVFSSASTAEEEAQIEKNNKDLDKEVHNPLTVPGRSRSAGSTSSAGSGGSGSGGGEENSAVIPFRLPVPIADTDSTVEVTRHGSIIVLPTIPEVESESMLYVPSPSPPPISAPALTLAPPVPPMPPPLPPPASALAVGSDELAAELPTLPPARPARPPRPPKSLPPTVPPPPPPRLSVSAHPAPVAAPVAAAVVDPLTTTAHIMFELKEADEEDSVDSFKSGQSGRSEANKSLIAATPSENSIDSLEQAPQLTSTATTAVEDKEDDFYWPEEENN